MKTFTKIMLILAGVFGTIGVICMVVAFAMGLTTTHLWDMVENGQFSFDSGDLEISGGNTTSEQTIHENCRNVEIDFDAGLLEIYYDDVEEIQVKCINIPNLETKVEKDTLEIGKKSGVHIHWHNNEERRLTIILPKDMEFERVELEVGAGQADVRGLITQKLELEVGAGQANVELIGMQKEYNYDIECGVGNVVIGGTSYAGLGTEQSVENEGATKQIRVECGVGEVQVNFTE